MDKFREKVIGFVCQMCRLEWNDGPCLLKNVAVGFLAAVIGDSLSISLEGKTIEIPLWRVTDIKARGPDWGWHDVVTWEEGTFSGRVALDKPQ